MAYADKENSEEVVRVLSYLEVVEKVKHSCDEVEVVHLIEEHKLEREQLLTEHLKSKQVSVSGTVPFSSSLYLPHVKHLSASVGVESSVEGNAPAGGAQVLR